MRKLVSPLGITALLVLAAGLSLSTPAVAQGEGPTVDVAFGVNGIDWVAGSGAERLILTVSQPNGQVIREELRGDRAAFDLYDKNGVRRPDGVYKWQIQVVPRVSREIQERVAAARGAGDEGALAELEQRGALPRGTVAHGSFQVVGGAIVAPGSVEPPTGPGRQTGGSGAPTLSTKDQVIPDDLIVQSSLCVGFDCVNGESFGFDTIRLKENNLRIHFDDTSTTAGFANRDWRIIANDDGSGGANKFSIEDSTGGLVPFTIEAASPNNSVYVDSTGRVGFRTSTPVLDLHVSTTNTPALRLEQTSAGGFTAQTWDIAGNEANFFVRDVTSGSRLPFRIRPGAPSSSIDIAADGQIGIGTASPDEQLDVRGGGISNIQLTTFAANLDDRADLIVRKARGSSAVPTAILNNDRIGGFQARAHDGTTFSDAAAFFDVRAEQNWSGTAHGTRLTFATTANNTTTATTRMVIENNGEVGIGTTSPSALLHVSGGNIQVTGGSFVDDGITLNVPDYVFEPGYELRPITELADFVAANKHLPNVPSRADVRAKGLNLSQFNMNLLEKVEELTLYTIDQHEQIAALKAEKEELAKRLAALEAAVLGKQ
ncbi:MAG TPA: hypothetical protein VF017_16390 [Thermoanaerobaculia bacterium]|nr:hypothetical protein [Thermoanaerobaculia bacterium]